VVDTACLLAFLFASSAGPHFYIPHSQSGLHCLPLDRAVLGMHSSRVAPLCATLTVALLSEAGGDYSCVRHILEVNFGLSSTEAEGTSR
jgi:hypothetical protein